MPTEVVSDFFLVLSHYCNKAYDRQMLTANETFRDPDRESASLSGRYSSQPVLSLEHPDFSTKKAELILISWL